jgi:cytoskeletal protein CcmA (bactofilin family)
MSRAWFALLMAALATKVGAQTPDHFVASRTVLIQNPVAGDLIAAGRNIEVNAAVSGDAALAGGEVRVAGRVSQDLYAAGGRLAVTGSVSRNTRMAGGQVTIGSGATLEGNLSAMGGEISLEGPVAGSVRAVGGRVYLNGPVGGDVQVRSGEVELGPNARIAGKLRYASDEELRRAPGTQVRGGIERMSSPSGWPIPGTVERQVVGRGSWIWTFGLMLLAAVLVAALPGFYSRVAATLQGRPGKSLLFGFVTLICMPLTALVFLITLIGVPLALVAIMLYLTLLLVSCPVNCL